MCEIASCCESSGDERRGRSWYCNGAEELLEGGGKLPYNGDEKDDPPDEDDGER